MENKYSMTVSDNIEFAKRNIVDSIYKEARIEGINVTFPQTQAIYEGASVSGLTVDDVVKINNLKKAWAFILDTLSYDFDVRYLRAINGFVQAGLTNTAGTFRTFDVGISGTSWTPELPSLDKIEEHLDKIRHVQNPTERSLELMLDVMRGQYFEDGNKRTAQIVANQEMIKNGCGIIAIPPDKKEEFGLLLIDYYETNNSSRIKPFLYDYCISGYERTLHLSEDDISRQKEDDLKHIFSSISDASSDKKPPFGHGLTKWMQKKAEAESKQKNGKETKKK